MLNKYRKFLKIVKSEIEVFAGLKNSSSIYYIEKSYRTNKLFKYLLLLRKKGVNLNEFFDEEIENNKL